VGCLLLSTAIAFAAGQPQWGQRYTRNMVSDEKGLPERFDPKTGLNIRWSVELGTETYSTPIVAGGHVFIGTNNARPRDKQHKGDCGVLMCFDAKDGRFCWQLVVPKLGPSPYLDWPKTGLVSPVTVEGNRVYLVTNRNEIVCLDLAGMANGNDGPYKDEGRHMGLPDGPSQPVNATDADILWLFDIDRELGVHQHDAAHGSILLDGQYLYVNTSNGVDDNHAKIVSPDAPSLIVLDKTTGRLAATDNEHMAPRTIHCTWSSPSLGQVNGRTLVFFGGGDGVVYAFEALQATVGRVSRPDTAGHGQAALPVGPAEATYLKKVWWFDCDPSAPKESIHSYMGNRQESPSNITGMPVFHKDRIYVEAGGDVWHGKRKAWLKCIDATKTGDITRTGQVWSYALEHHCMSTPAISDGLAFIGDDRGRFHCVDADTGRPYWVQDTAGEIWASPLVADGKVYVGNRASEFWVFAASKEEKVVATIEMDSPIHGTPIAANGALYVASMRRLYAIHR
jgi:outer membrane protein assembly factor BamB